MAKKDTTDERFIYGPSDQRPLSNLEILDLLMNSGTAMLENYTKIPRDYDKLVKRLNVIHPFIVALDTVCNSNLFTTVDSICSEFERQELEIFKEKVIYFGLFAEEYKRTTQLLGMEALLSKATDVKNTDVDLQAMFANHMWDDLQENVPHIVFTAGVVRNMYVNLFPN